MTATASPHRLRRTLAILVALALLGTAAAYGWQQWRAAGDKGPDYVFATVQRVDLEDLVSATGSVQPRDYVDVGAQVPGQLRRIHVEVGQEVKEGELLAEIDAEQSAARVEASRAQLRAQQASLVEREVNLAKAERDFQRQKNLMAAEATSAELLQNAETSLKAARAQVGTLKAQIEQTQASMRVEESNLKFTKIYAPMSGTVVSITARQGQTLNTNQSAPTILRIADESTMTIQTQVSEADVSKLRHGMPAYFTTLGSQGRRWHGTLGKIEPTPTVTNNVVLYNALFDVPNANRSLMTQMTAQVFFVVAEAKDALVVPMSAVAMQRGPATPLSTGEARPAPPAGAREGRAAMSDEERARLRAERRAAREGGGAPAMAPRGAGEPAAARAPRPATVRVASADGSIAERQVTVGVSNRVQAQIISGLEEGERVVAGVKQAEAPRRAQAGGIGAPPGMAAGGMRR